MLIKSSNVFSLNVRDLLYTLLTFTILLLFIWDDKSYLLIIFSVLSVLTFKITKIEFKFISLLLFYIALVTCYYLVRDSSEFVFFEGVNVESNTIQYYDLIRLLLGITSCFLIRYIIRAWGRDELFSVFKFLLWIVALPVLLQSVIYYLFGYHLDFYQYLGGSEPQRAFPFSGDIKYRPGGIFVEPGTHATYLMVMLFIYYGEKKQLEPVIFVALMSTLLTFSLFGFVFFLLFLFMIIKTMKGKKLRKYAQVAVIILSMPFIIKGYEYLDSRYLSKGHTLSFDINDKSLGVKLRPIQYWLEETSLDRKLLGSGGLLNDCGCLVADSGLLLSVTFFFGIVGLMFLIYVFFTSERTFRYGLICIMISKVSLYLPIFWLLFSLRNKKYV